MHGHTTYQDTIELILVLSKRNGVGVCEFGSCGFRYWQVAGFCLHGNVVSISINIRAYFLLAGALLTPK